MKELSCQTIGLIVRNVFTEKYILYKDGQSLPATGTQIPARPYATSPILIDDDDDSEDLT